MASPNRAAVVVDASIAIKWLLDEAGTQPAVRLIRERWLLLAPDLMLVEAANALWKKVRRAELSARELHHAIRGLLAFDIELHGSAPLLPRASQLAVKMNHPVYDCLYLALAADQSAILATADRRLREAATGAGVAFWEA